MSTGLRDKHGREIKVGDRVSLAHNITADDSMGCLPNGWHFLETDVYEVYYDERISNYSLKIDTVQFNNEPERQFDWTSLYDVKFLNHAVSLLHDGCTEIVESPS